MKYIKEFEKIGHFGFDKNNFGYFRVNRGDLIKCYAIDTLYLVLSENQSSRILCLAMIGTIGMDNINLFYEPTFMIEKMEYIKYRFLIHEEKLFLFKDMTEEKKCVELIKRYTDIDLREIEGYKEYEIKNDMEKFNL